MANINYNEFQAGQGVSAPDLNENFTLTNNALETMQTSLNSAISSLTSTTNLKANKNGSSAEVFSVANASNDTQAVNLGQLNSMIISHSPTGSVIWYAGNSVPDGYLLCDGRAISRTTYADLFAVIGVKYGAGDSSTTFNLPDLIDRFVKGNSTVATKQDSITTGIQSANHTHSYSAGTIPGSSTAGTSNNHAHSVGVKSLTLLPCIKE